MQLNEDSHLEASYEERTDIGDDMTEFDNDEMEGEEPERDMDESMDGDFDSAMASAGFGTDEDYGHYGGED